MVDQFRRSVSVGWTVYRDRLGLASHSYRLEPSRACPAKKRLVTIRSFSKPEFAKRPRWGGPAGVGERVAESVDTRAEPDGLVERVSPGCSMIGLGTGRLQPSREASKAAIKT
jgi:hypothetical protein